MFLRQESRLHVPELRVQLHGGSVLVLHMTVGMVAEAEGGQHASFIARTHALRRSCCCSCR